MIKDKDQSWMSFFLEMLLIISFVLFIRFYIFQFFRVHGPSMCPTLNELDQRCFEGKGEFIFVNELLYNFLRQPSRGEIVVFKPPNQKVYYIKRVIGVPGDRVEVKNGKLYLTHEAEGVQQKEMVEPYLSPRNKDRTRTSKNVFQVPEGYFLLFGDNRDKSLDSRFCFSSFGCDGENTPFVSQDDIQGRAEFVVWPLPLGRWLEHHQY